MLGELKDEEDWMYMKFNETERCHTIREKVRLEISMNEDNVAFSVQDDDIKITTGPIEYTDVRTETRRGGGDALYILDGKCSIARVFV